MAKSRAKRRVRPKAPTTSLGPFIALLALLVVAGLAGAIKEYSLPPARVEGPHLLTPPPGSAHVTESGFPPGMSKEQAKNMWADRSASAIMACPHPFVSKDVHDGLMRQDLGILYGIEPLEGFFGGVMASVRLHSFGGSPPRPTLKIQTSMLNLDYIPPQMNSTLVHECVGHLREAWFKQRPPEFFDDRYELHNAWKAYNMVESELYAYWIEAEFCTSNPADCPAIHGPLLAYREGGLDGMVRFMETAYENFPPWTNDFCPAAEQAIQDFRLRHVALVGSD